MSKNDKETVKKLDMEPYQKFLFFLVQDNPFLAIYFRRHQPSDGFIYSILNTENTEQGSLQVKNTLFDQIRKETTDLDKIAFLTKMVFGKHRVPGLVEDYLPDNWSEKQPDLKKFLMIEYTNQINDKNLDKVLAKVETPFDRWFVCKIFYPHAQRLQLAPYIKLINELPDQELWKNIGEEVRKLVHLPSISSPYPKEHISRAWAENIVD